MTEKSYGKIESFFNAHSALYSLLRLTYNYLPLAVFVSYPVLLAVLLIQYGPFSGIFLRELFVPAGVFIIVTVFRRAFNCQRPYEKYNINPLIQKDKKGQSFPSRHSASVFIIAMAFLRISVPLGVIFLIIGAIMSATRVLAGVHFIKDTILGGLFSVIIGAVFLFLI